jgi:hypothetical protein
MPLHMADYSNGLATLRGSCSPVSRAEMCKQKDCAEGFDLND